MAQGVRLYAGTQNGVTVWRSHNGSWEEISRGFENGIIDSIGGCKGHPERVFLGVTHDGLYRTEDGGHKWTKVLEGDIRSITIDPTDDKVIYAGTEPVHLYRSEDGGDTWEGLTSLMAFAISRGIRFFQTFVLKREQHPEDVRKKWWFPRPPHLAHITHIFIHPHDPKIIYLSIEHGGILRSLNRGESWEDVSGGIDYLDIHVIKTLPHSLERYYVSSARGFFTSNDPAQGWVRAENGFTRDYFHDFLFLPPSNKDENPTMLIATADQSPGHWDRAQNARSAVFRSFDCAQTWHRVGRGLPEILEAMVWALADHPHDPNAVFAGLGNVGRGYALPLPHYSGSGGAGTILLTRDRGESWEKLDIELPPDRILWAAAD